MFDKRERAKIEKWANLNMYSCKGFAEQYFIENFIDKWVLVKHDNRYEVKHFNNNKTNKIHMHKQNNTSSLFEALRIIVSHDHNKSNFNKMNRLTKLIDKL